MSSCNNRLVKFDLEYGATVAVNIGNVVTVYPVKSSGKLDSHDLCEIYFDNGEYVTVTNSLDEVISKFNNYPEWSKDIWKDAQI